MTASSIPELFHGLCDDAALFPPGNAPLGHAVPQHLGYRDAAYAHLVGPFVFPIPRLHELTPTKIDLSLTAPGGPSSIAAGLEAAQSIPGVSVVAVEVAIPDGTDLTALRAVADNVDVYVEIPRDDRRHDIFDAVERRGYRAKFRTGGVTADLYPDEAELAAGIAEASRRGVRFKATAGLHHAIRNTAADNGFEQHGYLNVLLAAQAAADGSSVRDLERILAIRDPDVVAKEVAAIDTDRAFLSFGTCSISEPLDDLISLGLINPL
ncbi:hypothetical protein CH304_18955 [Rhodococcus sp. 15-649-1-2]|nr:hypothetical protein [Rhodococcus sp. 15-649-1-2]OZE79508.1 hypothetical protein CH304_18955 [Rhodococcus sp. 15-649-1-2]